MIESKLFNVFVSLGVPGLALGVFYMLFRMFNWEFPIVSSNWVGPIVVLFMLLTSGIVFYALTLWRPRQSPVYRTGNGDTAPSGAAALHRVLELMGEFLERESDALEAQDSEAENVARQKELVAAAKTAVERTANHTRFYIASRRVGQRDRNTERELSDEWLEVGDCLRRIDNHEAQDLYTICFHKARYWSDPDGWNDSYAGGQDLSLDNVLNIIRNITAPQPNAG